MIIDGVTLINAKSSSGVGEGVVGGGPRGDTLNLACYIGLDYFWGLEI